MSVYDYYMLEKSSTIDLAKSFNKMRKIIEMNHIDYKDFNEYYEKYFKAVINNTLGFDYVTYGYSLLNASVILKTTDDKAIYNKQRLTLSRFLADYIIKSELNRTINPKEVYTNSKHMNKK